MRRKLAYAALFVLVPAVIGATIFEVAYRLYVSRTLQNRFWRAHLWIQNQQLARSETDIDQLFGLKVAAHPRGLFRTNANIDTAVIPVDPARTALNFSVKTNNIGLLSDRDYEFERDPASPEYRIVVLGESFTGTTTATYQWVDTLEDLLNDSAPLRAALGGKRIRTYNLGWVGGGFQTFWKEFDLSGRHFDPDLVLVNYVEIDFPRTDSTHMVDESKMVEHAAAHLRRIAGETREMIVTAMPLFAELAKPTLPLARTERLRIAMPELPIIDMRTVLPLPRSWAEAVSWYNIPQDAHFSDRGGELYARTLARLLAKRMAGLDIDFSKARTRYGHLVLRPATRTTRKVENSLSPIADRPDAVRRIYEHILSETQKGRWSKRRPYLWDILTRKGYDGIVQPLHERQYQALLKIPFGPAPTDVVHLNVSCTTSRIALSDPDCYTHLHMFYSDRAQ